MLSGLYWFHKISPDLAVLMVFSVEPKRYDGLEGLRALMASWVVFGHVGNFLGFHLGVNAPSWMKLVLLTSVPVNVFITLSGFVVFEMLRRKHVGYGIYVRSRAARIFPIYFFALGLAVLLGSFRHEALMDQPWRSASDLAAFSQRAEAVNADYWAHLAAHVPLLHGLVPENLLPHASQALLAPAWSLSLEWQFYLVAPAIYLVLTRRWWGALAIAVAFAVLQIAGEAYLPGLTNAAIINSWGYFYAGWACSRLLAVGGDGKVVRKNTMLMLLSIPFVLASALFVDPDVRAAGLSLLIWFAAFFGTCWPRSRGGAVRPIQEFIGRILSMGWLRKVGESSYSLYLLHVFVLDIVGWLLIRQGYLRGGDAENYLLLLGAVLPLSLIAAMLGYRFIERPFMALGRSRAHEKLHGA
ncbi:MAG: acyltransferase [Roseateles sp.]|uniref:acyltransferase family protein n=1 Tax=Roseateles sp. TaxID=1971397 RepID=UPI0039E98138